MLPNGYPKTNNTCTFLVLCQQSNFSHSSRLPQWREKEWVPWISYNIWSYNICWACAQLRLIRRSGYQISCEPWNGGFFPPKAKNCFFFLHISQSCRSHAPCADDKPRWHIFTIHPPTILLSSATLQQNVFPKTSFRIRLITFSLIFAVRNIHSASYAILTLLSKPI